MELLQVYFRYTLNILHLKGDIIHRSYNPHRDIKTHFRLINKKCALCTSNPPNKVSIKILYHKVSSYLSVNILIDLSYT